MRRMRPWRMNEQKGRGTGLSKFEVLGVSVPRTDALLEASGEVVYGADIVRPHMLHAAACYSSYAHAKILSVDTSEAEACPGVRAVITAKDVPCNRFGVKFQDQPVLADDKVRCMQDPIAVVAAETEQQAQYAASKVHVSYEPLVPVLDPMEGMKDQVLVQDGSNVVAHIKIRHGDVDAGFAASDYVLEETFCTQKVEHVPLEPHVALAELASDGQLVVTTSTSRAFAYITQMLKILKMDMTQLRLVTPPVGGAFGGKNEVSLEPWVALLTLKTGRPVKMVFSRKEEFYSTLRHPYRMTYKSGFTRDGALLARQIEIISDCGPYVGLGKDTLTKASVHAAGPYNIPNVRVDSYLVYTNTAVGGAMRGFGVPQVAFAHEVHTDAIARKLGMSPVEFRRKNLFFDRGQAPTGQLLDSRPLRATFERALELEQMQTPDGEVRA